MTGPHPGGVAGGNKGGGQRSPSFTTEKISIYRQLAIGVVRPCGLHLARSRNEPHREGLLADRPEWNYDQSRRTEEPETWTIAPAEIDTVAFSNTSQAVDRWRKWTRNRNPQHVTLGPEPHQCSRRDCTFTLFTFPAAAERKCNRKGSLTDIPIGFMIQYRVGGEGHVGATGKTGKWHYSVTSRPSL